MVNVNLQCWQMRMLEGSGVRWRRVVGKVICIFPPSKTLSVVEILCFTEVIGPPLHCRTVLVTPSLHMTFPAGALLTSCVWNRLYKFRLSRAGRHGWLLYYHMRWQECVAYREEEKETLHLPQSSLWLWRYNRCYSFLGWHKRILKKRQVCVVS